MRSVFKPECPQCGADNENLICEQVTREYAYIYEAGEGGYYASNVFDSNSPDVDFITCKACGTKWSSEVSFAKACEKQMMEEHE